MSFFAPPAVVKRMADDRAIAEADLSHLKTIIYEGAPMYLAPVVGRPDATVGPGRAAAELGENARCSRPQGRRPEPLDPPPYLGRRPGDGRGVLGNCSVGRARPRTHREETVR